MYYVRTTVIMDLIETVHDFGGKFKIWKVHLVYAIMYCAIKNDETDMYVPDKHPA